MRYLKELLERPTSEHWRFPVAYALGGCKMYSLTELVAARPPIKPPAELSSEEWRELVLARMRMHLAYQMTCPDGHVRTPREAVEAIESRRSVGKRIVNDQRDYIAAIVEDVYGESRPKASGTEPASMNSDIEG